MNNTGLGMGAPGGCKAVNHQINLTEICFDEIDHLSFHVVGESITVEAFSVEPGDFGLLMESRRVVPSCGSRLSLATLFLEEDADGCRPTAKSCRNSGGESVPR